MPARPPLRLLAVVIGVIEAIAVVGYALSLLVFSFTATTEGSTGSDVAGPVLALVTLALGALLGVVTWAIWRGQSAARTPFVLAQAFIIVAAWSLFTGDSGGMKIAGAVAIMLAVVAAISVFATGQDPDA